MAKQGQKEARNATHGANHVEKIKKIKNKKKFLSLMYFPATLGPEAFLGTGRTMTRAFIG